MRFTLYDGGERVSRHETSEEAQAAAVDRVGGAGRVQWVASADGGMLGVVDGGDRFAIREARATSRASRTDFSGVPPIGYASEFYYRGVGRPATPRGRRAN